MKLQSFTSFIVLITLSAAIFCACKKNNDAKTNLQVTGITPDSGRYSTIVTITGTGFSTNASENQVKFNGKDAVVQTATPSQLTVVVPKGAGTGPLSITVGNKSTTGLSFNYILTVTVSTLAGSTPGFADGPGSSAKFNYPEGVSTDINGNVYVADVVNNRIRKITPEGVVSTLAGDGAPGFADGPGSSAEFHAPVRVTIGPQGNIFVADVHNNRIRKITPEGIVTTLAGDGTSGFADGPGSSAKFNNPEGIIADTKGNIYISDAYNNRIRKITPGGVVTTLAGNGTGGFADGSGSSAEFNFPAGGTIDPQGNIYVADFYNNRIRKITPAGIVTTLAGDGTRGFADGAGSSSKFNFPGGVTNDSLGNIYVADIYNNRIRKITPEGVVSTLAGDGTGGFADGQGNSAKFNNPNDITIDPQGNIYVADVNNARIRKITQE